MKKIALAADASSSSCSACIPYVKRLHIGSLSYPRQKSSALKDCARKRRMNDRHNRAKEALATLLKDFLASFIEKLTALESVR